ncbi:MAG: Hsp70 family protein [Oscillospiraceae bacterium]|nr:Hsp70 family protein [Oscillospiraceae bacterium]
MQYWGFDLGDGESTLARVSGDGQTLPEIVPVDGNKVTITVWAVMKNGEVRIGENAARSASSAVRSAARFKRRFLDTQSDSAALIRDFSARVFESLRSDGSLVGGETGNSVYVGCPAGWDRANRERYQRIFETIGFPHPHVVSESRAVMVGAIQSNSVRDYVDLRSRSVLVIDIGSSTTDFAFINKGKETEIRTGGEVALGGGIMDEVLLNACVAASPDAEAIRAVFSESESWLVECELRARRLKEHYYSLPPEERIHADCSDSVLITYDDPVILDLVMNPEMSRRLTEKACPQLDGKSFHTEFCNGLREVRSSIGEISPELLFLTGGVSRMDEMRSWCQEVFPDAIIYTDREPEFSVARGLSWCGRVDHELSLFRAEVEELITSSKIESIVSGHLSELYESVLDKLLDPLLEKAVQPVLQDWRDGKLARLRNMESVLQERIRIYLYSEDAKAILYRPVSEWLQHVSEALEPYTSEICKKYHVPDRSLEISSALAASDFKLLGQIDARDLFSGDTFTWTTVFVDSVISILIAMLCGGSGVVLISEGPVGMLIGFVLSFLVIGLSHIMGKKAIDEKLMDINLPLSVRKMALGDLLPHVEGPRLGLNEEKKHLLPHIRWTKGGDIPERRLQSIKAKIKSNYEKAFNSAESEDLLALNSRMSSDISAQIEGRLKELAEQVEIPL